jgi:hypothetical protein
MSVGMEVIIENVPPPLLKRKIFAMNFHTNMVNNYKRINSNVDEKAKKGLGET